MIFWPRAWHGEPQNFYLTNSISKWTDRNLFQCIFSVKLAVIDFLHIVLLKYEKCKEYSNSLYSKYTSWKSIHKFIKNKRFSETLAIKDQQFRQKTKLINEVSQLANGVTDSMSELQDVQESVLDMKKFLEYRQL